MTASRESKAMTPEQPDHTDKDPAPADNLKTLLNYLDFWEHYQERAKSGLIRVRDIRRTSFLPVRPLTASDR